MNHNSTMNITVIIGSHRQVSNSAKVGSLVSQILLTQNPNLTISTIDLGKNPLPIWDEKVWEDDPTWIEILKPYREILNATDGLVVISPEYSGMASPALKNFFLFWGGETLAHKPAMIVGVTDSLHAGSYPVAELRMSSYKNTRILYIPDHVIVRSSEDLPDTIAKIKDKEQLRTISRLEHGTKILLAYAKALKPMRDETDFDYQTFAYGM
jgi:NAD(P)H-dependent FMN reductase